MLVQKLLFGKNPLGAHVDEGPLKSVVILNGREADGDDMHMGRNGVGPSKLPIEDIQFFEGDGVGEWYLISIPALLADNNSESFAVVISSSA